MKHTVAFSLLAALLVTLTWAISSEAISKDLSSGIVRLHILANSDSAEDQNLKLKVRDKLLAESKNKPNLLTDAEIEAICETEIKENGYDYAVTVQRGRFAFPRKTYDNLTLPAGTYNAVRVLIGDGEGQNWWCVMYPPLCFTGSTGGSLDADALNTLQHTISPESYAMVTEGNAITVKPSFKLVELWNELKAHLNS